MAMLAALFPADHPYHWTTIGETDDLHAARLEDVRRFFATYYHPANASLSMAGDIDVNAALALAETYFGELPSGPVVDPVRPPTPDLASETRLLMEEGYDALEIIADRFSPTIGGNQ